MDTRIQRVLDLMNHDPDRQLSLDQMARSVNLSPSRFSHLFKLQTGMSPARYQRWLRMQRARQLLETSLLTIKQIAGRIGIRDESHFWRDFKKIYGLTPSEYRASYFAGNKPTEDPGKAK